MKLDEDPSEQEEQVRRKRRSRKNEEQRGAARAATIAFDSEEWDEMTQAGWSVKGSSSLLVGAGYVLAPWRGSTDQPMWRKLIARYLLLARAILPLLRHTRGAARGRRKSPRRLLGLGSAAFSPFYCDKNPDGERPAFWETGFYGGGPPLQHICATAMRH